MIATDRFAQVEIASAGALWHWLERNHRQGESVWLVTFRKHLADRFVAGGEVLDARVSYGWIDGIRRKLDADRTMQLVSPRRTQRWAASYKARAARLIAAVVDHAARRQRLPQM